MNNTLIDNLKALHKLAFGDSDVYTNFFFDKRFSKNNFFYKEIDGTVAGVVYARIMRFNTITENCQLSTVNSTSVPFFTGIATHPSFRNQGIARELIDQAVSAYGKRGFSFVLLSPFDEGFYKNLGFETVTRVEKSIIGGRLPSPISHLTSLPITQANLHIVKKLYDAEAKRHKIYRIRTQNEFNLIWQAHSSDGGLGYLVYKNGNPVGYFLTDNETITECIPLSTKYLVHLKEAHGKTALILSDKGEAHIMLRPTIHNSQFTIHNYLNLFLYEKY
jgi:predicted acetyltransferase